MKKLQKVKNKLYNISILQNHKTQYLYYIQIIKIKKNLFDKIKTYIDSSIKPKTSYMCI